MSAAPAGTGTANADRPLEATMARDAIAAVAVAVAGADDMSSGLSGGRIGGGDASSSSIDDGGHAHGNHSPQHAAGDSIAALPDPATFITSEQEHKDPDDSYVYHHHHHHHHTTDRTSLHSSRDSLEMAALSDEDIALIGDEEEAGLTTKERRERRRRTRLRRRQQQQHGRDGGLDSSSSFSSSHDYEGRISEEGRRAADRLVVRNLAVNVVLILLWYFFSLSISIYNKWMFSSDHLNFEFPLFTTSLHMAVQFSLASLIIYIFPSLRPGGAPHPQPPATAATTTTTTTSPSPSPSPPPGSPTTATAFSAKHILTRHFYLARLVPCGVATSLDIGLGNMSMRFITLTFVTMCKSSALAFVLLFAFLFGLEQPSLRLIAIIGAMTVGVVMMVAGEAAFDALGFALVIASAFFSGFRWGLTQILLLRHPATANPFATLFLLTPIMFAALALIAAAVEGPAHIARGLHALVHASGLLFSVGLLVFPGCLAFCMIAAEFALLKRSSVVTLSICGIFKEVVTISAAGAVFKDRLSPVNIAGLAVTIASIASYNYMKITRMRREARMDVSAAAGMGGRKGGADAPHGPHAGSAHPVHGSDYDTDSDIEAAAGTRRSVGANGRSRSGGGGTGNGSGSFTSVRSASPGLIAQTHPARTFS